MTTEQVEGIDFAFAAFCQEGHWQLEEIADPMLVDFDALTAGLRRFRGDQGVLALIAIDEDFFLLLRVDGPRVRVLLSDITAAEEWELASEVVEHLRLPEPEDDDEPAPAGDLGLLDDLGMSAGDLGRLLDDDELYPDEMLSEVATRIGFGELFDDLVGLETA